MCITIYGGFNVPGIVLCMLHMLFSDLQNKPIQYYLYVIDNDIETEKG